MQSLFNFIKENSEYNEFPYYVKVIADRIEEKFHLNIEVPKLLMISMPPRSLKTTIASRCFPLWICKHFSGKKICLSSYSPEIANINLKNLQEKTVCKNIVSVSVGAALIGYLSDIIIIDDYIKNDINVDSIKFQENLYRWWENSVTKLNSNGLYIIVSSRWDKNDLIGKILQQVRTQNMSFLIDYLNLSAISLHNDPFNRVINNSFWPQKYSNDKLLELKECIGEKWWQSLYQGNPT